jgi:hypothetical protein
VWNYGCGGGESEYLSNWKGSVKNKAPARNLITDQPSFPSLDISQETQNYNHWITMVDTRGSDIEFCRVFSYWIVIQEK